MDCRGTPVPSCGGKPVCLAGTRVALLQRAVLVLPRPPCLEQRKADAAPRGCAGWSESRGGAGAQKGSARSNRATVWPTREGLTASMERCSQSSSPGTRTRGPVSYTHLRAHETSAHL
eukprot:7318689-Alexandrium_andersonii.AAC.1